MTRGTVFDIKKFAIHDGPGIRTTVFLKGCPMACAWCHNPEGQRPEPETMTGGHDDAGAAIVGTVMGVDQVLAEVAKDGLFYDESGGGVTFSGGEPFQQPDFLTGLLEGCRRRGIHTAVDTTGHAAPEVLAAISPLVDLFLYDLKVMDDTRHRKYTGVSNQGIIANLEYLVKAGREVIIRFPMIPQVNDTADNLERMGAYLKNLGLRRLDLLPYHAIHRQKYHRLGHPERLGNIPVPDANAIARVKTDLESSGLTVRVGG
jgi:pyruvate formate lyase activating enzyme